VKRAISKGLLKDLNGIEKNVYPKKDTEAITRVLYRFGMPPENS
jgi:hypothetical protein